MRVGAPRGGRVHWLLGYLHNDIKDNYTVEYNYYYHRYCIYRIKYRRMVDCFIVVRTSKRCFRLMYVNVACSYITYRTYKTSLSCAYDIHLIYQRFNE